LKKQENQKASKKKEQRKNIPSRQPDGKKKARQNTRPGLGKLSRKKLGRNMTESSMRSAWRTEERIARPASEPPEKDSATTKGKRNRSGVRKTRENQKRHSSVVGRATNSGLKSIEESYMQEKSTSNNSKKRNGGGGKSFRK